MILQEADLGAGGGERPRPSSSVGAAGAGPHPWPRERRRSGLEVASSALRSGAKPLAGAGWTCDSSTAGGEAPSGSATTTVEAGEASCTRSHAAEDGVVKAGEKQAPRLVPNFLMRHARAATGERVRLLGMAEARAAKAVPERRRDTGDTSLRRRPAVGMTAPPGRTCTLERSTRR